MEAFIPIGQFAALAWLSPKALRLYDENGVLRPAHVDPNSGYRFYSSDQVATARLVALLRGGGVSLASIREFLQDPGEERLREYEAALERDVEARRRSLALARGLLTGSQKEVRMKTPPSTSAAPLTRAVPVLASLDLDNTLSFYTDRLAFERVFRAEDVAMVRRDTVEILFWLCDDENIPANTSCRIETAEIDDLYREYTAAGVIHPNGPLEEKPWGLREFAAIDGDQNLLTFFARPPTP